MIRQFWWGLIKNERKLAWLSLDKMCLPKEKRGLAFSRPKKFQPGSLG